LSHLELIGVNGPQRFGVPISLDYASNTTEKSG